MGLVPNKWRSTRRASQEHGVAVRPQCGGGAVPPRRPGHSPPRPDVCTVATGAALYKQGCRTNRLHINIASLSCISPLNSIQFSSMIILVPFPWQLCGSEETQPAWLAAGYRCVRTNKAGWLHSCPTLQGRHKENCCNKPPLFVFVAQAGLGYCRPLSHRGEISL